MSYKIQEEEHNINTVNEAVQQYVTSLKPSSTYKSINYKDFFNNKMLIVHTIRKGVPYSFFDAIKKSAPFTDLEWANFLDTSSKSLQRYRQEANHVFKPSHSEKIIELAEVIRLGNDVFDSTQQFYLWLKTPTFALENLKPIELLKDSYGKEMVVTEINRIDQGVFA